MNPGAGQHRAARVELDQEAGELVIGWRDGHTSRLPLRDLRRACPCANCKDARQKAAGRGLINLLQGEAATATAAATAVERVGRYGVRITWADGHDYGIYTLESLRARDRRAPSGS